MKQADRLTALTKLVDETIITRRAIIESMGSQILELIDILSGVIGSGGKILAVGNGGSMALAMHFASDLVVRLSAERNRQALPALALGVNPAVMSAAANDYGWEHVYARQVEALGRKGDILLILSTSGKALNLVKAVNMAKDKGILTAALLGGTGGNLKRSVDRSIIVPHSSSQRIHEEHLFIVHLLSEGVERDLFV